MEKRNVINIQNSYFLEVVTSTIMFTEAKNLQEKLVASVRNYFVQLLFQ